MIVEFFSVEIVLRVWKKKTNIKNITKHLQLKYIDFSANFFFHLQIT